MARNDQGKKVRYSQKSATFSKKSKIENSTAPIAELLEKKDEK